MGKPAANSDAGEEEIHSYKGNDLKVWLFQPYIFTFWIHALKCINSVSSLTSPKKVPLSKAINPQQLLSSLLYSEAAAQRFSCVIKSTVSLKCVHTHTHVI